MSAWQPAPSISYLSRGSSAQQTVTHCHRVGGAWRRAWDALMLAAFMNLRAGLFYELLSCFMGKGDKETFAAALAAVGAPYAVVATPLGSAGLVRTSCRHERGACAFGCLRLCSRGQRILPAELDATCASVNRALPGA